MILLLFLVIDFNRFIIGNLEMFKVFIGLIEEGGLFIIEVVFVVFNICIVLENREKVILFGLIFVLMNKIKEGSSVVELLFFLVLVFIYNCGVKEMNDLGFINDLLSILRKLSCLVIYENVVVIVFNMCD